ncbi:right-handed parallel beta-helix repeat-containing protein, partial [bacterium]|nr:right-handed parallel beta-helix repeat-containing protein [bacterium]
NKKLLVSVLLCFFVFSLGVVSQEFGVPAQEKEWKAAIQAEEEGLVSIIYVDDATGDDEKGDGREKRPFKTISKALSVANSRLTVIKVGPGDYDEYLTPRWKNVYFEGSGIENSFINGISVAFCDFVGIEGFTISGSSVLCGSDSYVKIIDCVISDSIGIGVRVSRDSSAYLHNCQIINSNSWGVVVHYNSYAILLKCSISNNALGINHGGILADANSSMVLGDCEVEGNNICGISISNNSYLYMANGSSVHDNQTGIEISDDSLVRLRNTFIEGNSLNGINVEHASCLTIDWSVFVSGNGGVGVSVQNFSRAFLEGAEIRNNLDKDVVIHTGQ